MVSKIASGQVNLFIFLDLYERKLKYNFHLFSKFQASPISHIIHPENPAIYVIPPSSLGESIE